MKIRTIAYGSNSTHNYKASSTHTVPTTSVLKLIVRNIVLSEIT